MLYLKLFKSHSLLADITPIEPIENIQTGDESPIRILIYFYAVYSVCFIFKIIFFKFESS